MSLPSYDLVQLAQHAAFCTAAVSEDDLGPAVLRGITSFRWIERADEGITVAENDCLVEFSEEAHEQLRQLYSNWVQTYRPLVAPATSAGVLNATELRDCLSRAEEWLKVQDEIATHSLPHAELSRMAQAANLSAGARSVSPIKH